MNSWLFPAVIATLLSTMLMASSYGYLFFQERQVELKLFFIAWFIYALRFSVKLIQIFYPECEILMNLILVLMLLNGALLFIASRQLLRKSAKRMLSTLMVLSPLIVLFNIIIGFDHFINTTIVFLISGIIYILVGINFLRNQKIKIGMKYFIGIILILWGMHKFDYPFLHDSVFFAPIGYMLGAVFSLTSALSILMLYYEIQKENLKKRTCELKDSKEKTERLNLVLNETKDKLKLKLDYILNPDIEYTEYIEVIDVLSPELLQKIQDSFAEATGVAALITDVNGTPITAPSNFTDLCTIIRQTEVGLKNCIKSDMEIGRRAAKLLQPVYEECQGCGLIDASAPIIIGNKHVANWMIGQSNSGLTDGKTIQEYAEAIGVDKNIMLDAFHNAERIEIKKFEKIVNLLWLFSKELSAYAFNNIMLAKKIEEIKLTQSALVAAKEKAEENDRLKNAFLSNVSHEIRTPLNGILGFVNLLSADNLGNKERGRFINLINESGERLLRTIEDIISISIIQTEQIEVNISEFYINSLFEILLTRYEPIAAAKGLSLVYENTGKAEILSDEHKIGVILSKLIDNAVKYTSEGEISMGFKMLGNSIEMHITDSGIGIAEQKVDFIFNQFEQAESDYTRSFEGIGLGLSIAKAYAEALGGNIAAESSGTSKTVRAKTWSRFTVNIPV